MIALNTTEPEHRTNKPKQNQWDIAGLSAQGIRESLEDHWCVLSVSDPNGAWTLGCIFDGVGGIPRGEDASQAAARAVIDFINSEPLNSPLDPQADDTRLLKDALDYANIAVEELRGPATTAVIVLARSADQITIAWVGDSRAYIVDHTGNTQQLTTDHSDTRIDSLGFPRSALTRWLGSSEHSEPEAVTVEVERGSTILLTTDGVHDVLSQADLGELSAGQIGSVSQEVVQLALDLGSSDNCTCLALRPQATSTTTQSPVLPNASTRQISRSIT